VLPVAGFLAGALVITAVIDLLNGTAPWNGEVGHLPEVVSVVLVWLLAVPAPRRRRRVATDDLRPTGLRVVRDADDRAS
jgi:hypothetical protein